MKIITSKDNKIFKKALSLTSKKYRDRLDQYLVEGEKLVNEALAAGLVEVVIIESSYKREIHYDEGDFVFMMGKLFERLAQTEHSQGIIAIVNKRKYTEKEFAEILKEKNGNVVVLDCLQDPGNIGTIIRTADAASYSGLIAIKGTGDIYSPKVVRSTAGSVLRLPLLQVETQEKAIEFLKENNKTVVGTCFETDKYFYEVDLRNNIGLVIGNEGNGMSKTFIDNADINVKIPMEYPVDSLNASVAAGILMYQSKVKGE
ncbi:MAG: RNA methyltransferase [Anaerovoracaceae bacterium]